MPHRQPLTALPPGERVPEVARVRREVARALDGEAVLRVGETVVVACSGGPDSSALVDALARLAPPRRLSLVVAHVDHGLRPGSAAEASHVAGLAASRGLAFRALAVSVTAGGSLQDRARQARHQALRSLAAETGATAIALGHTADDQAETVLMRLLSGASPRGLRAMSARDGLLARPLLRVWRDHVVAYCAVLGMEVIDDPSNRDPRFLRSRVRHQLLPALEAVFPGARRRLVILAERMRDANVKGQLNSDPMLDCPR
ncbi:MAG TPA: tRNA lysidine(34) synthetase TilS [Candidatus Dormibacteraeota bacterium]|jgi:tRNA(Ile)-lysidine synthetase-like protein|nr:tRNA lysidine(34) synthetase TilS [Candidatus Dormibacteraeota bacterium]